MNNRTRNLPGEGFVPGFRFQATNNFLNEVLRGLNDVELFESVNTVSEGEHLVAEEVDDRLKRLYSLSMQWGRQSEEALVAARYTQDGTRKEELSQNALALRAKGALAREIFWVDLKDAYSLWGKDNVGIRQGWKVVWFDEESPPPQLVDALSALGFVKK